MRARRGILVVIALGSIALGACATPAVPTAPPTERPTPTPVPGATLAGIVSINLIARNIEFATRTLQAPAGVQFAIHLANADAPGVRHLVDLRLGDGTPVLPEHDPIEGGEQADYVFGPLPAGEYSFICRIHPIPTMTGMLQVR